MRGVSASVVASTSLTSPSGDLIKTVSMLSSFPAGIALLHERCLHLEVIEGRPVRAHHHRISLRGGQIHVHRVAIGINLEMQKRRPRWSTRWDCADREPEKAGIRRGGILFRRPQVDREAMREVQ